MTTGTISTFPSAVIHADWSTDPKKRWLARATLEDGRYVLHAPEAVGASSALLEALRALAGEGPILAGFDFPIGLPARYAERAGVESFPELLPRLGRGRWKDFYTVAERREEIGVHRPFYPQRPGGTRRSHLVEALGLDSAGDLLRTVDRAHPGRRVAASIFWTMGAQQVGKATISGWREVLVPLLLGSPDGRTKLWPFEGELGDLLAPGYLVLAETYPAEFYRQLGLDVGSKRDPEDRRANAPALLRWAEKAQTDLTSDVREAINRGFGPSPEGEHPFDATVGLCGMLNVVLGFRSPGEPPDATTRRVEGWMLGRQSPSRTEAGPSPEEPAEYDPLADLYDLEYDHDYDLPFWLSLAAREAGPIVEWGAGTGRLSAPLSEAGFEVTAVEVSGEMVERGRRRGEAVEWVRGDMREAPLGRRYGLAICAFNSFLCLTSPEDALTFLRNARAHLLPDGLLGIEVSAFPPEELSEPPGGPALRHDLTRELPQGTLERFSISGYDAASQTLSMRLFYELYGASGTLESKRSHELQIRVTSRDELSLMLRLAGFSLEAIYGGFEGEPFTTASDHLVVLARPLGLIQGSPDARPGLGGS